MWDPQNAMPMLITSRCAENTLYICVYWFEVEKATKGFVDAVVVARQGFRRITRDEGTRKGCSFAKITGRRGSRNEVNRKESPRRKPCLAAFPSRGITIDSRTIGNSFVKGKKFTEKPIQTNSVAEEMVLENFPRQQTIYCSF